jgi:hypothetical protein
VTGANVCREVLGLLTPVNQAELYVNPEPPLSKEELDERSRDKSVTDTTAEVLAYLRAMEEES